MILAPLRQHLGTPGLAKPLIIQVGSLRRRLIKGLPCSSTVSLLVKPWPLITVQCSFYSSLLPSGILLLPEIKYRFHGEFSSLHL